MISIAIHGVAMPLFAQDIEEEFEAFSRRQQQAFEDFKTQADAEFETFLRETWQKFETQSPEELPLRPEPPQPLSFDENRPKLPAVKIEAILSPVSSKVPTTSPLPILSPNPTVQREPISFYNLQLPVATEIVKNFALKGDKEGDVADAWESLCKQNYEPLIADCLHLKEQYRLSDWAYLLFTQQLGEQLMGKQRGNDVAFLQMFLLTQSGYKVKLAKVGEELKLMLATEQTLYGLPYLKMEDGNRYYIFHPNPQSGKSLFTYPHAFAGAKSLVSLQMKQLPVFESGSHKRQISLPQYRIQLESVVNENLMAFYRDYPQCTIDIHYHTPMSEELQNSLLPPLKQLLQRKGETEAVSWLLGFIQQAFAYQTDGEQFGSEKTFFLDEPFFYPACDCEDRAILFATLVKELTGLSAVLLDYPGHIAAAVRFTQPVEGDSISLEDGDYLICDPTYIGAPIGESMPQFKNVVPKVIL